MASQLSIECLNEILEYLEKDRLTLYSCLLVNQLWCKVAVRILWSNIWDFISSYQRRLFKVPLLFFKILSILIACLPYESKELLHKKQISIPTPTSNPPLFNYPEFCKVLSIDDITMIVCECIDIIEDQSLVANEIIKMFINPISFLKKLTYYDDDDFNLNISFPHVSWTELSELCCSSNLSSDFFYQLSQISHNLQSITISFDNDVSNELNELKELISSQNNLKNLTLSAFDGYSWANIIPAIIKHSQTIAKLQLYDDSDNLPFSFVSLFTNLQEFIFLFTDGVDFEDFKKLQYVNFFKLAILKIPNKCPKPEYLMKFLENNGKNLQYFYAVENNKAVNLSIAKFCPKIRSIFVLFSDDVIDILKTIFINCKDLECIKIWGHCDLEVLDTVANYSPCNCHELNIIYYSKLDVSPEDLESFFISWKNRTPKKLLTLIFIGFNGSEKSLKEILKKYENLGAIKFRLKSSVEVIDEELVFYY
jgi:hypothetical protein